MFKNNFWLKLAFEGLALFLSVMAAFWMEDYRVEKQEKLEYIANLSLFREESHSDIKVFLRPIYLDTVWSTNKTRNEYRDSVLLKSVGLLSRKDSFPKFIEENYWSRSPILKAQNSNRFISRSAIELYKYNSFLIQDSLVKIAWSYQAKHRLNQDQFEEYDRLANQINETISYLDFNDPYNKNNLNYRHILENKILMLSMTELLGEYHFESIANEMVYITQTLDAVLFKYGIDTSTLDKKNIEYYNDWVKLRDSGN